MTGGKTKTTRTTRGAGIVIFVFFVLFVILYNGIMRHGFVLIEKERGPTSHDVIEELREILHESKIGHLGTLDPAASGLLVAAVGSKALKVVELFGGLSKEYVAQIRFGSISSTYDSEGVIAAVPPKAGWTPPQDASTIQATIQDRFLGSIKQIPPAHSAVSVGGSRAYRKARRGLAVSLPERIVHILACDILSYAYPDLGLRVRCGSGTYIRSLAHDLGQSLRCGAYLAGLTRTKVGEWSLDQARPTSKVQWTDVMPLKNILSEFSRRDLDEREWADLQHGRSIEGVMPTSGPLLAWHGELPVVLLERDARKDGLLKPRKVL